MSFRQLCSPLSYIYSCLSFQGTYHLLCPTRSSYPGLYWCWYCQYLQWSRNTGSEEIQDESRYEVRADQTNNSLPPPQLENELLDIILAWNPPPQIIPSILPSKCGRDFETATERIIGGLESHKLMSPEIRRVIGAWCVDLALFLYSTSKSMLFHTWLMLLSALIASTISFTPITSNWFPLAYHEAGHAVAGWNLEHADPLLKVRKICCRLLDYECYLGCPAIPHLSISKTSRILYQNCSSPHPFNLVHPR